MTDSLENIFQGLTEDQIREVLDAMEQKARGFKGAQVDNNFLKSLNEQEARQVEADLEASKQRIAAQRMAPRIEEYKQAMRATPRGPNGNSARAAIKRHYRAEGVPVDSVDFT